jgi:cytochrome c peroxidase
MTRHLRLAILFLTIQGCGPDGPGAVGDAVRELRADELPASPTNRYADDPRAAELGRQLFFDPRMSANGQLSCAGCHDPRTGFADARPRSAGTGGDLGGRHALPVTTAAFQTFVLWDGRADALWQQPLMALEAPIEMDFTRAEVAHFVGRSWRTEYEEIFGALPALEALPARARPGMPAWDALTATERDALTRVAVNVGKAIEAYERKILCTDTRFDAWTRGEAALSAAELEWPRGLRGRQLHQLPRRRALLGWPVPRPGPEPRRQRRPRARRRAACPAGQRAQRRRQVLR